MNVLECRGAWMAEDHAMQLSDADMKRLDALYLEIEARIRRFIGYPCNEEFDYDQLHRFLKYSTNNVGDPFGPTTFHINTRELEVEVIEFFAKLLHAPTEGYWGYVTNGGTEGNLYGLYLARELMPGGIVYYSEDTHYSVSKNLHLLNMRNIMIRSQDSGEIDYEDLRETLRIHRDVPPILFANIGTTMREGHDDVVRIKKLFREMAIPAHYVHCDAALCGMTLPFIQGATPFDFAAGADSVSISGHKFIGSPIPCGIVLARKRNVERIARSIEYIGALDTTITGSRNAWTPLVLWTAIRSRGMEGFTEMVRKCLEAAQYAVQKLNDAGIKARRNPNAITVVFPRPSESLRHRWQLAVHNDIAHLITMPHVTRAIIDEFVAELVSEPRQKLEADMGAEA